MTSAPVVYRAVNVEGFITYRQNRYSVPWQHIGRMLPVRITETEVIVYGPQVEEIARHAAVAAHGDRTSGASARSTAPARTPGSARPSCRSASRNWVRRAVRFLEGLLRTQRYGKDQAQRVLALLGTYHPVRRARRPGTGRTLRRLHPRGRGTHPGGAGPAQERPGDPGRGRATALCRPGWTTSRSHPGPRPTTNPCVTRSRRTMPTRPTPTPADT